MHISSTISELCTKFPEMLHSLQDINLQLLSSEVEFCLGNIFRAQKPNRTNITWNKVSKFIANAHKIIP